MMRQILGILTKILLLFAGCRRACKKHINIDGWQALLLLVGTMRAFKLPADMLRYKMKAPARKIPRRIEEAIYKKMPLKRGAKISRMPPRYIQLRERAARALLFYRVCRHIRRRHACSPCCCCPVTSRRPCLRPLSAA